MSLVPVSSRSVRQAWLHVRFPFPGSFPSSFAVNAALEVFIRDGIGLLVSRPPFDVSYIHGVFRSHTIGCAGFPFTSSPPTAFASALEF
jgi:hypothetical protein